VAHVSATEALLGAGRIVVKVSCREFVLLAVLAAYKVVAEGLFNLVSGFAEQILGILGVAFGEVSGSFILAVKKVTFLFGKVTTMGEGNVFPEARGTQLNRGSGSQGGSAKGIGAGVNRQLRDRAFERSGNLQELTSGVMISGEAVQDVIIMGDNTT
jgi:hypothetical protein